MPLHFFESKMDMPAGMVVLPLRCTLVKMSASCVVISPIDFSSAQIAEINRLGPVTDLVAPSLLHHLFLKKAVQHFPNAKIWGPPGIREKCPDVKGITVFNEAEWPYKKDLDALFVEGIPRLSEIVFLHRETQTLITADLCFNLIKPEGWAAPVMLRMLGTYKKFAVSRLSNKFMKDQNAFDVSMQKMLAWDFDKIAMGHGDLVASGGKTKFRSALRERGHSVP